MNGDGVRGVRRWAVRMKLDDKKGFKDEGY